MKSSRVRGKVKSMDGPSGGDFDWKVFGVFVVIMVGLVAAAELFSDREDPALEAATELCKSTMPEVANVNGTWGALGVKEGWWAAEAYVVDGDVVRVVCAKHDVTTVDMVE